MLKFKPPLPFERAVVHDGESSVSQQISFFAGLVGLDRKAGMVQRLLIWFESLRDLFLAPLQGPAFVLGLIVGRKLVEGCRYDTVDCSVCIGFLASGLATAQPLKEIRIGSSNISYTNFSTFYARDRKFFEKEGLSPKIIVVKTEAALPAMATGQLDYTTLTTSTIEAAMMGMPLRLVAVANQQPLWGVVARKGMTRVAELKNKKLA